MPDKTDLQYCMTLPPEKAVEYLRSKGYEISWDWEDVWQEAHAKAFTVAKIIKLDILQDIRSAIEQAIYEGKTFKWFEKELTPVLKSKGWWGRQDLKNPATGETESVQLGSSWRLETIYRTNLQTAYMAGRYSRQMDNVDAMPYWQYIAVMDGRTRPAHRALHGLVFRFDDPFWQSFYPPNGWRCRCRVMTLSAADLTRYGLRAVSSSGLLSTTQKLVSPRTGELRPVTVFQSEKGSVSPDVGWSHNPGSAFVPDKSRYTGNIKTLADKVL